MRTLLKSYLKKLTNLTGSNKSLLHLRLSSEQDMDLHALDYLNKEPSFAIVEKLIAGKKSFSLCPNLDSRNEKVNEAGKILKKIDRREKFIFDERGGKDLYVAWPFVRGKFADGTIVRAPLLFFPVTLELKEKDWMLSLRKDVAVSFNKSFLLAYAHYNEVSLSDDFIETSFEDAATDSQVFRTELYQLLKQSAVEINFNQDLFANKLESFQNFKKDDYEQKYKKGELILQSEAVLGIFPQAGSYLVPDYNFLIENSADKNVEEFFLEKSISGVDKNLSTIKEEQVFTPFRQDASQENAIKHLKKGRSLVVQGPPGTGKSQLICNLISDFIARGKNVLLVCQKRAALDVVYERLKEKNLSPFVGLVHDFKNDRKEIFDQISSQIEKLDEYKYRNSGLDSVYLERKFLQESRRIDQITEELEEFKKAFFDNKESGLSVKELYLSSDPSAPLIDVKHEYKYFGLAEIEKFKKLLKVYLPYAFRFEKSDYIWKDRISFSDLSGLDKKKVLELLERIPFYQTEVAEKLRVLIGASLDLEDFNWLLGKTEQMEQIIHLLDDDIAYANFIFLLNKNPDHDWIMIREKLISECFKGEGVEHSIPTYQLGYFQKALENASQLRGKFIKWMWWKYFSKDKYLVKRAFVANQIKFDKNGFDELIRKVDNRLNLEHNITELKESGWFQHVPEEKDLEILSEWMHHQQTAIAARTILKDLRGLKEYLNISSLSYLELKSKLNAIKEILTDIPEERNRWIKFLSPKHISNILEGYDFALELAEVLKKDFESLVEFDKMRNNLISYEKVVMEKLLNNSKGDNVEQVIALFENSIKLEWIESIELKYPILRAVSSLKMEQMENELQESIEEKLKLSQEIVLMKVRERVYKNVEYNRLDNMVTYRDLKHQVTKKKKIWPIRKVVDEFSSEIFQLIPCWMASPESVSAVFSMHQKFDLVIFDEASQCYSEKGIPAIYRGHNIVITGDSQQLSPSDIYQVRWEEEDEDNVDLSLNSLLDLGKKYLLEVKLQGHYRSKHLELIDFSNTHFYNGQLNVLPHYDDVTKTTPAIEYMKVNGIWEDNTNRKEAETVVSEIKRLLDVNSEKTIGVVTFNYKQQNLIQDLLEQKLKSAIPDSIFVKNIENVQGDERDIIIFSVGYAPDKNDRMIMNFGSLNSDKGENRLNVAITRAREKIYIVSSILPAQLNVEDSKHVGPKLFKKYLEYALNVSKGKYTPAPKFAEGYKSNFLLKRNIEESLSGSSIKVSEEFPFADVTLKKDQQSVGLLLTDDDKYYQSTSVKESHAYVPIAMRNKNWKYKKVFSRNYWENKQAIKDSIIKAFTNND